MANDLATLRGKLDTQLRDTDHEAWTQSEKEDLITWAVRGLYPRFARPISLPISPLDPDTEDYLVPTGIREINRIELADATTDLSLGFLDAGSWDWYGDPLGDDLTLHINLAFTDADNYLVVHGFGVYDFSDNPIPDDWVPLVLARARAEAYRRQGADRARFLQWQASEQTQNVSMNELLNEIAEADREAEVLSQRTERTWRRPVQGRIG